MAFKSRSRGKIAKAEGRLVALCLSATVYCFLPVRSKPLFTYKRTVCLMIILYDCLFYIVGLVFFFFFFAVSSVYYFFCLVFLIINFEVFLSPNKHSSVKFC